MMRLLGCWTATICVIATTVGPAAAQTTPSTGALFGAREGVTQMSLSPMGDKIAFVAPGGGQSSTLFTVAVAGGEPSKVFTASGAPERLRACTWVTNDRLICGYGGVVKTPDAGLVNFFKWIAVNADGSNPKVLSDRGSTFGGGSPIDLLESSDGAILMTRRFERAWPSTGSISILAKAGGSNNRAAWLRNISQTATVISRL
jgi:hypothetical protein